MINLFQNHQPEIDNLIKEYGITYLALFGSHARGEEKPDSDVDLLVDYRKPVGLIKFVGLERMLSGILNKKVDLVSKKGLSKFIYPYIKNDLKVLYEIN